MIPSRVASRKTPSHRRSFIVAIATVASWPLSIDASPLSESDVIAKARSQSPALTVARRATAVAKAERRTTGLHPNPSLNWGHERFVGSPTDSEHAVFLEIPIDLGRQRATGKLLADSRVADARAHAARVQSNAVSRALRAFYALIATKRQVVLDQQAVARLSRAAHIILRRKQEGKVSGYDLSRIEIEKELAVSALKQSQARANQRRVALALRLDLDAKTARFSGSLAPSIGLAAGARTATVSGRRSFALLNTAGNLARRASDTASRRWLPRLSVTGGLRLGSADRTRAGYVAGLSMELPVFSRTSRLRAKTKAVARHTMARIKLVERAARIELTRARNELVAANAELKRFKSATQDRIKRLERAAETGYREGRRTLVELLDARRARAAVERRLLALSALVKRSEIAVRAARGEYE